MWHIYFLIVHFKFIFHYIRAPAGHKICWPSFLGIFTCWSDHYNWNFLYFLIRFFYPVKIEVKIYLFNKHHTKSKMSVGRQLPVSDSWCALARPLCQRSNISPTKRPDTWFKKSKCLGPRHAFIYNRFRVITTNSFSSL